MRGATTEEREDHLIALLRAGEAAAPALDGAFPEELADAIERLEPEERGAALGRLDPETAGLTLIELPTDTTRALVADLPDATLARFLDLLPMDDAVDLREEIGEERFERLLKAIPKEDEEEIRRLLSHPPDSAGQLMTEDFLSVGPEATMADVLRAIREADEETELVNYVYVLDPERRLLGVLTLRRVLRAEPSAAARDVMNPEPRSAPVETPGEEIARAIARYGISALPILDGGRMVGIVTADDAQAILQEADTEDVLLLGGVTGDAEPYLSLSVIELVKRRLPWLLVLFVAEFFTGNVLRYYIPSSGEDDPRNALLVAARLMPFVPLLIGAGGNAGSQVTMTITRALALGEIRGRDWARVARREFVVGLICGLALALVAGLRASLAGPIGYSQPPYIAFSVAAALPCILVWSAMVGAGLPIAAKRIGIDPAVMSAPFIATFVDATGLVIFFEIAQRVVGLYGRSV